MLDTCLCFKFQIMSSRSVAPCEFWFACLVVCGEKVGGPFAKFSLLYCLCCSLYVYLHLIISQSPPCSLCLPCLFSGCSCPAWIIYTHILDSLPSRLNHWPDCCGEIHCPLNSNITLITFNTMTMQGSWTWMNDIVWKIYLFKSSI